MGVYAIHYDNTTGEILSLTAAQYGSSGDLLVNSLPPSYSNSAYKVKIDNGTPMPYLIKRSNGYAYDINGQRASLYDENEEEESGSILSGSDVEPRGISLGGGGTNVVVTTTTEVDGGGTTTTTETVNVNDDENENLSSDDMDYVRGVANDSLAKIGSGSAVLCSLSLTRADWAYISEETQWTFPGASIVSPRYVFAIEDENITSSTVLNMLGLTRQNLNTHIYWGCESGRITFETAARPKGDITVYCYLMETGDDWSAYGIIEAWPAANLVSKRYRHSLHASQDIIDITGSEPTTYDEGFAIAAGDSVNVQTPIDFSAATLLFATPEWTGHSHVIIPHVYVNASDKLCYTLTNLSANAVRISEVAIRLMFRGQVSNMVTDANDEGFISGYITDEDIDELTE